MDISTCLLITFGLFILYLINKLGISPYLLTLQLRKKYPDSVDVVYFPLLGILPEIIGQMKQGKDPFFLYKKKRHDNPKLKFRISLGIKDKPYISVLDPEMIKQLFQNEANYEKLNNFLFMDHKNKHTHGLAEAEGEVWKKQRLILSQIFHFQNVKNMIPQVQQVINEQMKNLKTEENIKAIKYCSSVTGKSVINTFFGKELTEKWNKEIEIEQEMRNILIARMVVQRNSVWYKLRAMIFGKQFYDHKFLLTKYEKSLKERLDYFQNYCNEYIDSKILQQKQGKLPEKEKEMFINLIIQKYLEGQLNYEQIFNNFSDFFFAGMDSTGTFAAICLYHLGQYPQIQEKLYQEIQEFYQKNGELNELADLNSFKYLNNFVKESFRFFSPAPGTLMRTAKKDHYLGDFLVKKGWVVQGFFGVDAVNPEIVSNSNEFNPDRWDTPEMKNLHPYQFIPFSAGSRNCIGQSMAQIETKLIIINMLKNYQVHAIKDKKMQIALDIIVTVKDDELIYLTQRK